MSEPAPHILVVDDDREIRDPLAKYLASNGYHALAADSAATARRQLKSHAFDLIVLDIMMPGEDGLSFCRSLRETSQVPVLFLTARSGDVDRIVGIELGADDYVVKPFNPRELLARIGAILAVSARCRRRRNRRPRAASNSTAGFSTLFAASSSPQTASLCRAATIAC